MMETMADRQRLHCDGYYTSCIHRGDKDIFDRRFRHVCESKGKYITLSSKSIDCPHCAERKVRRKSRNGSVVIVRAGG